MFAALGDIVFEVLNSPERFESTRAFSYAEHKPLEARPRLQWLSDDLEKISLELAFHSAWANPQTQMLLLAAAAEDHRARPLVFGNGILRGYFVMTSLQETHLHNADDGSLIYATARVELQEWALGSEIDPLAPPKPVTPPPAIITAPTGTTAAGFNPNAPLGPNNLLPESALVTLSTLPAGTYQPGAYNTPGTSPLVNNPPVTAPPTPKTMPGDVPVQRIVGN
jgi:phage protein U